MNRHRLAVLPLALAGTLLLGACSSDEDTDTSTADTVADDTTFTDDELVTDDSEYGAEILAGFSSCDDVAPAVALYIEGLDPSPSNSVDEWGVNCEWETPDTATSLDEIRSVEIVIAPGTGEVPTPEILEAGDLEVIPDAALESAGGIAYTMSEAIAVAAVSVTRIELPEVSVSITGGQWGDYPSLDAPAAVIVTKELLGL